MPKIPFKDIEIMTQKRNSKRDKIYEIKENTGLDTETYKGYVKLICDHTGDYKFIDSFTDILNFLTHRCFRNKFNWFYNIKFDFESIIKYLEKDELITLYQNKTIERNSFTINYIDKKFFSILDKNNNNYYFYDLFNFLDTSLDKASKKFLNNEKLKTVDANKLNTDWDYWQNNLDDIVKYCVYDANLTKRLADYFWLIIFKNLKYSPTKPFSKGKISEEYFLSRCFIPTINAIKENPIGLKILQTAYNSYYGGRFELLQKGFFENVYTYDIKSAYPAQIASLIDFNKGKWQKVRKLSPDATEGFYKAKIECKEALFCPVVQKINELSIYPNGRFNQYLTKKEIVFIKERFPNARVSIEYGYEFIAKDLYYPFKTEIERLYQWKEKEPDEDIKYVVKIILNSLYGKTIQLAGVNLETGKRKSGKLFNPLYASLITSHTRIKLLELGCQKPECVIMFSTDAIHSTEKLNVPLKPALGEFAKDFQGCGVYLMSDVYNLWNETKTKNKLRGFSLVSEKDIDSAGILLRDILENLNSTKYEYITKRPFHLGECLLHNKTLSVDDINIFGEVKKTININGDTKRIWDKEFKNGKQCLKESVGSLPIEV